MDSRCALGIVVVSSAGASTLAGFVRLKLINVLFLSFAVVLFGPLVNVEASGQAIDVRIPAEGAWTAHLVGFDLSKVHSVDYYVRDANSHWWHLPTVTNAPFDADIEWWLGDNGGYEAVTAHVHTSDGKEIKDPGGWHWVNGAHANPGGHLLGFKNEDGSASASYQPAHQADLISAINFFLRDKNGHWTMAGTGAEIEDGLWRLDRLPGTTDGDWAGSKVRLSVHVVWQGDREWIDPVATTDSFAVVASAPPAPTPTPGVAAPSCRTGDPLAGVYHPYRLLVLSACQRFRGTVLANLHEPDGDNHLWIKPDTGYEGFLNKSNIYHGDAALVAEVVPACSSTPANSSAAASCPASALTEPAVGAHVEVVGAWVLDRDHGWQEIHPVNFLAMNPPPLVAATPTPTQTPNPAPAVQPPPAVKPPPAAPPPPPPAAGDLCGAPANPWGYNLCGRGGFITSPPQNFCQVFAPCVTSFWTSANGYVVRCGDGTWSHSGGVRGVCNKNNGVAATLYGGP